MAIEILRFLLAFIITTVVCLLPIWIPVVGIIFGATKLQLVLSCIISTIVWVAAGLWFIYQDEKKCLTKQK